MSTELPAADEGCMSLDDAAQCYWMDSDLQPQILDKLDCFMEGARFAERWLRPAPPRPKSEWHEDDGAVVWWHFDPGAELPNGEAAYIGSPLADDWPDTEDYFTHWTPHPAPPRR